MQRICPALPVLLAFALIFFSLTPRRLLPMAEITPLLPVACYYYWTLYKPKLMPLPAVFALGVVSDAASGLPLGLSSFLSVLLCLAAASQRKAITKQNFGTLWFAFALIAAGYSALYWLLLSISYHVWLPAPPCLLQWALTVGCYPLVHILCTVIYAALPRTIALRR